MIGNTHHSNIAPPVRSISVTFIAISIETIEIKDIPIAVLKANFIGIWLLRITVSRIIDVINPFIIARLMIANTGQYMPEN
jgi:hypothetical protein